MGNGAGSPADLAEYLAGISFPADRREVLHRAREQGAPEEVLNLLERIPDQPYASRGEVVQAAGLVE